MPNLQTDDEILRSIIDKSVISIESNSITRVGNMKFQYCNNLVSADFPNMESIEGDAFNNSTLQTAFFPKGRTYASYNFGNNSVITSAVIGGFSSPGSSANSYTFYGCSNLAIVDVGTLGRGSIGTGTFTNCAKLKTIILRSTTRLSLDNTNAFNNTPFKSGGTGGTIYIPKALYDHLGDGTSSDYRAASNWSTLNGYGTITWAQIEGSTYETHYGNGELIPTS